MKRLWKKINDTTILIRLSGTIIFVFIILLILSFLNYINQRQNDQKSTFNIVNQTNLQISKEIDDFLMDLSNITKQPLVYRQNENSYLNTLYHFDLTNSNTWEFQKMNEQLFETIMAYKPNVNSCYIFNTKGYCDYKTRTPIYSTFSPLEYDWFSKSIDKFGKPTIVDTYQYPNVAYRDTPLYVFGIARGMVYIEKGAVIGVLLVNVPTDYFKENFSIMKITDNHRIMLLHDDYVIYDTEESFITQTAPESITSIQWENSDSFVPVTMDGTKYLAASVCSDYSGWRLVSLISEEELYADLLVSQRNTLLFTIGLSIVALLFMAIISRQIVVPIKHLCLLMQQAEKGDFDVQVQVVHHDEVGMLTESFNSMTSKIKELIQDVYLERIAQSELELQMLQAQINPHFLYNTLESISMMAIIHDDDTTSEMAQNLGTILRYGISNYHQEVTVQDEINTLKKYIALQEIRFSAKYDIIVDVDSAFYDIPTIKMILQPIVENAIYHGMSHIRYHGTITISAQIIDNDVLQFQVADNGIGMSQEETRILNDYINDKNTAFKSIGLRNVNKRIKLRYGNTFGVQILSQQNKGTTVLITIPA